MRIDETKIFEFKFPFYGGEFSIPIRAETRDVAASQLKQVLNNFMVDLATEFPIAAAGGQTPPSRGPERVVESPQQNVPSYALELDIENLIKELMPIKKPKGGNGIAKLVKDWTGFEYSPENYLAIIEELKKQKS